MSLISLLTIFAFKITYKIMDAKILDNFQLQNVNNKNI